MAKGKRSAKSKNPWQDHYARKAKKEKQPARSVYKLQEIQGKFRVIKRGDRVLDLGCSPGSWLLYAAEQVGKSGSVTGIDLKPTTIALPSHVTTLLFDVNDIPTEPSETDPIGDGFQVVLSDMAPATTGNKNVDNARSYQLSETALSIARNRLTPGGSFVCKIFQGEDFEVFDKEVRLSFQTRRIFKPQSSRKASREIYVIGLRKR